MRKILVALLAFAVAAPALVSAQNARTNEADYVVGGTQVRGETILLGDEYHHGPILLPAHGGQDPDQTGAFDEVHVVVDDDVNPEVYAYYSFHEDDHIPETPFGGTLNSLGAGTFCGQATLEVPEKAAYLRIALNAPITFLQTECLPHYATAGTITAHFSSSAS